MVDRLFAPSPFARWYAIEAKESRRKGSRGGRGAKERGGEEARRKFENSFRPSIKIWSRRMNFSSLRNRSGGPLGPPRFREGKFNKREGRLEAVRARGSSLSPRNIKTWLGAGSCGERNFGRAALRSAPILIVRVIRAVEGVVEEKKKKRRREGGRRWRSEEGREEESARIGRCNSWKVGSVAFVSE